MRAASSGESWLPALLLRWSRSARTHPARLRQTPSTPCHRRSAIASSMPTAIARTWTGGGDLSGGSAHVRTRRQPQRRRPQQFAADDANFSGANLSNATLDGMDGRRRLQQRHLDGCPRHERRIQRDHVRHLVHRRDARGRHLQHCPMPERASSAAPRSTRDLRRRRPHRRQVRRRQHGARRRSRGGAQQCRPVGRRPAAPASNGRADGAKLEGASSSTPTSPGSTCRVCR